MVSTSQTDKEIRAERRAYLEEQREQQKNAYPNRGGFDQIVSIRSARKLTEANQHVVLAGRINSRRKAGKATFADLADGGEQLGDGEDDHSNSIQLYASSQNKDLLAWLNHLHMGDIIYVAGNLFITRKGELTVNLTEGRLLAKCLEPYTIKDSLAETRQRKRRYLALAVQPQMRAQFRARSNIIKSIRKFFDDKKYLEVETPILHEIQGGALAKPFKTRHAALERDFYLRIAPELYLKRLLVGGFDKVYELGKTFRNEGMSDKHNPEFTMLEFYAAYQRYTDLMELIANLLRYLIAQDWYELYHRSKLTYESSNDSPVVKQGKLLIDNKLVDASDAFTIITLRDCLREKLKLSEEQLDDKKFLLQKTAKLRGGKAQRADDAIEIGYLHTLLFEKQVEAKLIEPTFVTDFPACVSPLARRKDDAQDLAERFELFVGGKEVANGFSELNDPDEQTKVFQQQVEAAQAGDDEAMQYDADFIRALSYGMPPAAGAGIGIDRIAMLLLGLDSIQDVIIFPQLRRDIDKFSHSISCVK